MAVPSLKKGIQTDKVQRLSSGEFASRRIAGARLLPLV